MAFWSLMMMWRRSALIAVSFLLASLGNAVAGPCASTATVASYTPGTVSPMLFGTHLLFNQATDRLRAKPEFMASLLSVPVHSLRFPGGTIGENYLWEKKETARQDWFPFNHKASSNDLDFDEFMSAAKCLGAQPSIVLNLRYWLAAGKLDEGMAEAEDWVRYANKEKGYGVRYWELGNELYGNKPQAQAPLTSRDYGKYYAEFRRRLKDVDPSVEIGLVLPPKIDLVASGDNESWWRGAFEGAGGQVDYVVIHRYVVETPRALERKGSTYDDTLRNARRMLKSVVGQDVPIHLTEWNTGSKSASRDGPLKPDTIGHALFVADAIADQADYGVRFSTFWPLIGPKKQGFLTGPDLTLNVPGRVMQMLSRLAGWQVVQRQRRDRELQWNLYRGPNNRMAALLINWGQETARFDWNKAAGGCEAAGEMMRPASGRRDALALQGGLTEDVVSGISGDFAVPGYTVTLVLSKSGASCSK